MHKRTVLLAGTAAAMLGLGACGQQAGQTQRQDPNAANDLTALNAPVAADPGAETANGSSAAPVAVVAPPEPAPDAPSTEAAPLTEAASITEEISQGGSDVERIPYQGGWAWRQKGRIVRTASADGRRVSYFGPGEATPFLVQQDKQAVALSNGKVQRAYTPQGRPQAPDPSTKRAGEQLAQQATRDRSRATEVAKTEPSKVQKEAPARNRDQSGSPASTPNRSDNANRADTSRTRGSTDSRHSSRPDNRTEANQVEDAPRRR